MKNKTPELSSYKCKALLHLKCSAQDIPTTFSRKLLFSFIHTGQLYF